ASIMHGVQKVRCGVGRTSPIVLYSAMPEVPVDFARMNGTVLPDEIQKKPGFLLSLRRPTAAAFRGDAGFRTWMHQLLNGTGDKSVVDEEILVHVQFGVATFQIPGAIIRYAVAQNQI